jgi:hypothetical protein
LIRGLYIRLKGMTPAKGEVFRKQNGNETAE